MDRMQSSFRRGVAIVLALFASSAPLAAQEESTPAQQFRARADLGLPEDAATLWSHAADYTAKEAGNGAGQARWRPLLEPQVAVRAAEGALPLTICRDGDKVLFPITAAFRFWAAAGKEDAILLGAPADKKLIFQRHLAQLAVDARDPQDRQDYKEQLAQRLLERGWERWAVIVLPVRWKPGDPAATESGHPAGAAAEPLKCEILTGDEPAKREVRVTWQGRTRTFSSDELERALGLAAVGEKPNTPATVPPAQHQSPAAPAAKLPTTTVVAPGSTVGPAAGIAKPAGPAKPPATSVPQETYVLVLDWSRLWKQPSDFQWLLETIEQTRAACAKHNAALEVFVATPEKLVVWPDADLGRRARPAVPPHANGTLKALKTALEAVAGQKHAGPLQATYFLTSFPEESIAGRASDWKATDAEQPAKAEPSTLRIALLEKESGARHAELHRLAAQAGLEVWQAGGERLWPFDLLVARSKYNVTDYDRTRPCLLPIGEAKP
jgi:hypothetical protein